MLTKVQRKLENLIERQPGTKPLLIVALSGGADSVCLLLVLRELREQMEFELEALHIEHGIRGKESLEDAAFVEKLCKGLSISCHVAHVDVPAFAMEKGIGTEEAARLLRYRVFSEYASKQNGQMVLAHHMDDNAETVLFQMLRGSGLKGMCGISRARWDENGVKFLRPFLHIRRSEIEEYLEQAGQAYCTDSTNLENEYNRNYLRNEIIPRLKEINSAAVPHISKTAAYLEEVRDFLSMEAQKAMDRLRVREQDAVILDAEELKNLHSALQKEVIYEAVAEAAGSKKDITSAHVEAVLWLLTLQSGKQVSLPYGVTAQKSFQKIILRKEKQKSFENKEVQKSSFEISEEMLADWKGEGEEQELVLSEQEKFVFKLFPYDGDSEKIPQKPCTKWLDYDKIKSGFCIRRRENGDFFISDEKGHRKKLKNYFIDEKIPQEERNTLWLLAQDSLVFLITKGRISEHVKVTKETKTIIEIQYFGGK